MGNKTNTVFVLIMLCLAVLTVGLSIHTLPYNAENMTFICMFAALFVVPIVLALNRVLDDKSESSQEAELSRIERMPDGPKKERRMRCFYAGISPKASNTELLAAERKNKLAHLRQKFNLPSVMPDHMVEPEVARLIRISLNLPADEDATEEQLREARLVKMRKAFGVPADCPEYYLPIELAVMYTSESEWDQAAYFDHLAFHLAYGVPMNCSPEERMRAMKRIKRQAYTLPLSASEEELQAAMTAQLENQRAQRRKGGKFGAALVPIQVLDSL